MYAFAKKTDFFPRSEGLLEITYYGIANVSAKDSTYNSSDSYIANQAAKSWDNKFPQAPKIYSSWPLYAKYISLPLI